MFEYESMRQFADSWGLVYLMAVFIGVILYTFRPGSKKSAQEIAHIPLREDDEDVR